MIRNAKKHIDFSEPVVVHNVCKPRTMDSCKDLLTKVSKFELETWSHFSTSIIRFLFHNPHPEKRHQVAFSVSTYWY